MLKVNREKVQLSEYGCLIKPDFVNLLYGKAENKGIIGRR